MNTIKLQKDIQDLVVKSAFSLRNDVRKALLIAYLRETNELSKKALKWILDNASTAKKEGVAICQDTGLPVVFIEVGNDVAIEASLVKTIEDAIAAGYKKNYLRPSVVDPIKRGKATYKGCVVHTEFSSKNKGLKITLFPKGFGSENKSKLAMLNPTASIKDIEDFVVDAVESAGPASCPPFVVGVGIGGTCDEALLLAKKSLLGDIGKKNVRLDLAELEARLLKRINALNIGPMGFGGKTTALAVRVKAGPTHIAGLPVGVNISCHALRSATLQVKVK